MSIASAITAAQGRVAAAYTSCNTMGATMPAPSDQDLSHLPATIESIPSGGGGCGENYEDDVIFIDYDGTVLHRYTKAEFLALSAMPDNPTQTGLTAQGWNWDLADAQTYVTECGALVIGQMYITDDNCHRIHITLDDPANLSPTFYFTNGSTIDWGDGTTPQTASGNVQHTYAATGDYVISSTGVATAGPPVLENTTANRSTYANIIKGVNVGLTNGQIQTYSYQYCSALKFITLPDNITSFQSGATFHCCSALKAVVLPKSITTTGNYFIQWCPALEVISLNKTASLGTIPFQQCSSLVRLHIPPGTTTIPANGCNPCTHLRLVTSASATTAVGNGAFQNCLTLTDIRLTASTASFGDYSLSQIMSGFSYTFPASTTTIAQRTLQGSLITELTIGANVTSIGNYAFFSCPWLQTVHVKAATPPSAGSGIFQGDSSLTKIYVPTGKLATYQGAAGWSTYASLMEEE